MPKLLPPEPQRPDQFGVVVLAHFEQLAVRVDEVEVLDAQAISATAQVAQFPRRGSLPGRQRHARLHPEGLVAEQLVAVTQIHEASCRGFSDLLGYAVERSGRSLRVCRQPNTSDRPQAPAREATMAATRAAPSMPKPNTTAPPARPK
jgi:hypothetical protein